MHSRILRCARRRRECRGRMAVDERLQSMQREGGMASLSPDTDGLEGIISPESDSVPILADPCGEGPTV